MEPQVQHLDGHRAQITVTVDAETKDKAMREAAKRLAPQLRIHGFRPGKAPYDIILSNVGEDYLLNEALEDIVNDIYRQVLDSTDLEPYSAGSVTDIQTEGGLTITFEIPKRPVVDLGDYRALRVDFEAPEATDEQIEKSMARTREELGVSNEVQRPAALNDDVVMDIHAYFVDEDAETNTDEAEAAETEAETEALISADVETAEDAHDHDDDEHDHDHHHDEDKGELFMHEHDFHYLLLEDDSRDLVPGFSAALIGVTAGESRNFTLSFSDEDEEEELRGRAVEFDVTVKSVQETILPVLDDFMAQVASDGELKTVAELRERIQQNLQTELENRANNQYANDVIEKLVEQSSFIYPDEIVEDYVDEIIDEIDEYLQQQAGFGIEDYVNMTGGGMDDLRAQNRERAIERMKNTLALTAVAEAEAIKISMQDIDDEIDRQIIAFGGAGQVELFRSLFNNPDARDRIASQVLSNRTIERIIEIGKGLAPAKGSSESDEATAVADDSTEADTESVESEEA